MVDDRLARAQRIAATARTPGFGDMREWLDGQIAGHRSAVDYLMQSKPETLTGKTAIAKSNRMKAHLDFKAWIAEQVKIATESQ